MWRQRYLRLLIVCLLFAVGSATAQADTINDSGLWLAFFSRGELPVHQEEKGACESVCECEVESAWRWWFDGHARFFDDYDGFGQSLIRPGVGYQVTDQATLWAGYAWIHTSPATAPFDEHRVWQQLTWSTKLETATIGSRSRLEQRFLETGSDTGWRFRQLVSLRRPLECAPNMTFVAWDEVFLNFNDTNWGAQAGFDQNRAFIGFGWKPSDNADWRVEIGYLNQYIERSSQDDVCNHLLSMNLFWNP